MLSLNRVARLILVTLVAVSAVLAQPRNASAQSRGITGAIVKAIELPIGHSPTAQTTALRVDFVIDGFPAQAVGVREGDIILSMNGKPTDSEASLAQIEADVGPNATVPLVLLRQGRQVTVSLTLVPIPPDYGARQAAYLNAQLTAEEAAASKSEAAGDLAHAFDHDVRALRLAFFVPYTPGFIERLLGNTGALLPRLRPRPAIPSEADRHNRRAVAFLQSAKAVEDYDRAAEEFKSAIFEAPWLGDLWLNYGLAAEKAGRVENAITDFRSYLALNPAPRDLDTVNQRLASLEVLAEERKPWLPFLRTWTSTTRGTTSIELRDRDLTVTYLAAPTASSPGYRSGYRPGDVMLRAVIHGREFQGKWFVRLGPDDGPAAAKCFGEGYELESYGGLDAAGTALTVNTSSSNFNPNTCQETGARTVRTTLNLHL